MSCTLSSGNFGLWWPWACGPPGAPARPHLGWSPRQRPLGHRPDLALPRAGPGWCTVTPQAIHQMKGPLRRKRHFLRAGARLSSRTLSTPILSLGRAQRPSFLPSEAPSPAQTQAPHCFPSPHLFILHTSIRRLCMPQRGPWCLCCHQSSWDTLYFLSL